MTAKTAKKHVNKKYKGDQDNMGTCLLDAHSAHL